MRLGKGSLHDRRVAEWAGEEEGMERGMEKGEIISASAAF